MIMFGKPWLSEVSLVSVKLKIECRNCTKSREFEWGINLPDEDGLVVTTDQLMEEGQFFFETEGWRSCTTPDEVNSACCPECSKELEAMDKAGDFDQ